MAWFGGLTGDDVSTASANSTDDYHPRTQGEKAGMTGNTLAVDVTAPRGWIDPAEPYSAAPAAPVFSSRAPTTAVKGENPVEVTLTGTGFTPFSAVTVDGIIYPTEYVSATELKVDLKSTVAVVHTLRVMDHGATSVAGHSFTFTES